MTTGLIVQLGTVVGSVAGMPQIFGTTDHWWLIYVVEVVILVVALLVLPITHESPGYLLLHGAEEAARKSLIFYYSCSEDEAEYHLAEIKDNIARSTSSVGMLEVWKNPTYRRGTIVGCMVAFAMAFSGIAVINAFAVEILRETGLTVFEASLANVGLSVISLIATTLSSLVVDKFGRRRLLLITNVAILLLNVLIFGFMLAFDKHEASESSLYGWLGICLIVAIALFIVAFATGPGPLCYFITSELLGQNARSAGQSWASLVQMTSRSILLAVFLPMGNAIGKAYSYLLLFVAPILFAVVFFYYNLPETKNKNLLEVEEEITKLPRFPCCRTVRVIDVRAEQLSDNTQISTVS
ncbi:Protein C35A11.4 [Aphelenchoides avenae]|nr:Protein C35A11.4 [Aphelenchus avenae]